MADVQGLGKFRRAFAGGVAIAAKNVLISAM
jgi:hypothetical protein